MEATVKERIKEFLSYLNMGQNRFEERVGFSNGYINNVKSLGSDKINKIANAYPELNAEWLLTGKGQMLKGDLDNQDSNVTIHYGDRKTRDAIIDEQEVPLYNIEATAGLVELFKSEQTAQILDTIKIPKLPKCDGAITVTGDSMYPLLKSGDMIIYKQIPTDNKSIFFGEMYLLGVRIDEQEEMITVKYVQKSDKGEEYIRLVSLNQHHSSKDVLLSDITAMAIVKASIRFNTMF